VWKDDKACPDSKVQFYLLLRGFGFVLRGLFYVPSKIWNAAAGNASLVQAAAAVAVAFLEAANVWNPEMRTSANEQPVIFPPLQESP